MINGACGPVWTRTVDITEEKQKLCFVECNRIIDCALFKCILRIAGNKNEFLVSSYTLDQMDREH